MGRTLAIDYGKRRSGLAVTDTLGLIANPLVTVETRSLLSYVRDYVEREEVERVVVGLPHQTNGRESETLPEARRFVERMRGELPEGVEVCWWDERYTSVLAHRAMVESGIGRMRRRDKALVDEIAACIILQGYMESRRLGGGRETKDGEEGEGN